MKKKLTMINNIVCVLLMIALFATMLIPCWDFVAEEKVKVRVCRACGTEAELEEGSTKVRADYVCTGLVKASEKKTEEKEEAPEATEPVETTEPSVDATEAIEATEAVEARTVDATEATEEATVEATEEATEATEAVVEEEPADDEMVPCGNDSSLKNYKLQEKKISFEDDSSVMEFTWFSYDNKSLSAKFIADGYAINDIVLVPFVVTLFAIAGVLFCLVNMKGTWHSIFPAAAGLMTAYTYLTVPAFQMGQWQLTLGCAIALGVAGLALFAQFMTKVIKWFVVPCHKK